jgi:multicomponent Na+:H+ antiporter subunit E
MLPFLNIVLTLVWAGLFGVVNAETLISGFVISYIVLFILSRSQRESPAYFSKVPKVLSFIAYYLWELLKSNFIVAYDVLTPTHHMTPGVVAIPIRAKTDFEIALLANLITMTPGTVTLDVSEDRKTLYVHAMYIDDPETLRADITNNLERRVLEILR